MTPYAHHIMGLPKREVTQALDIAAKQSLAEHGVEMAYIFDIPRSSDGRRPRSPSTTRWGNLPPRW